MRRYGILFVAALAFTGIACPPAPKDDPTKTDVKFSDTQPPLQNLQQLKDRTELALEKVRQRDLLADHGFWTVFHAILGTGPEKTMLKPPGSKEKVNAIDYICNGGELPGLEFKPTKHGLDVTTVEGPRNENLQFIAQGHRDQFIAEMAQWGMQPNRPFKVGGQAKTFQNFIDHSLMTANLNAQPPQELSWTIIIVSQFYGTKHVWKNENNVELRFEQIVQYELDQSIEKAACGGTHRLFGLTWAYHVHLRAGGKKEGVWLDVEKRIADYKEIARKLQKADGTFSLNYFEAEVPPPEGAPKDTAELAIGTTGHIVEWLALAMTDEELRSSWMQSAVNGLSLQIIDIRKKSIDGGSLYHAAHGLHLYHERVFGTPAPFLALLPQEPRKK